MHEADRVAAEWLEKQRAMEEEEAQRRKRSGYLLS